MESPFPQNFPEFLFLGRKFLKKLLPKKFLELYLTFFPTFGYFFFRKPSRKLRVIGVTGTDGKSSTVIFIARILAEAGYKIGYSSSVFLNDGEREYPNILKMTMPGRFFLQKFLSTLVHNKCDYAIIEVTSEGIKQKRHLCIDFDIVLITNLNAEHIEAHNGFENYRETKSSIFKNLKKTFSKNIPKTIIANGDDIHAKSFLSFEADQKISFGLKDLECSVKGRILETNFLRNKLEVTIGQESFEMNVPLGGPFVPRNILGALAVATAIGIPGAICKSALEKAEVIPGRFEIVRDAPWILIDYAHTVAAVEEMLLYIRSHWPHQIIHLFGAAGGGRDRWKRKHLAEISERFADISLLTEENSFDENTEAILREIQSGFQNRERARVIPGRKEAVQEALGLQTIDTLILLTGKGCETVKAGPLGRKTPYNEKETTLCLLETF